MDVNVSDVILAEPMPWDVFLLTMVGLNGFFAAVSLAGFVGFQVTRGLYWFLREFFALEPQERWRIVINGLMPVLLTMLCCALAAAGEYARLTPNVAFGAFQVGLVVGFGPYIGISVGKAAVQGTRRVVERARGGKAEKSEGAEAGRTEAQDG